jgi:hypothetical protein
VIWKQEPLRSAATRAGYVFVVACVLAYLEVQIEGPHGWAAALPTWRTTAPGLTWIMGGRPVTGYHVSLVLLLLLLLHWPALFVRWSLLHEIRVLQAFAVLAIVWDFLWFVINPHFGLERYGPETVWWFRRWTLGVPSDYWVGAFIGLLLWVLPVLLRKMPARAAIGEAALGLLIPMAGAALVTLVVSRQ